MDRRPLDYSRTEDVVDIKPLESPLPLSHDEIHETSELLKELIEKVRGNPAGLTQEEKEKKKKELKDKFEKERQYVAGMTQDEIINFVRNCKKDSPNYVKLQENPALALALSEKIIRLTPKI